VTNHVRLDDQFRVGSEVAIDSMRWTEPEQLEQVTDTPPTVWTVWKEQEMAEQQRKLQAEADMKLQRKNIAEEIRKQRLGESQG